MTPITFTYTYSELFEGAVVPVVVSEFQKYRLLAIP